MHGLDSRVGFIDLLLVLFRKLFNEFGDAGVVRDIGGVFFLSAVDSVRLKVPQFFAFLDLVSGAVAQINQLCPDNALTRDNLVGGSFNTDKFDFLA